MLISHKLKINPGLEIGKNLYVLAAIYDNKKLLISDKLIEKKNNPSIEVPHFLRESE